jgi:hypothetical protein
LAWDKDKLWAVVKMVMNIPSPQKRGIYFLAEEVLAFGEGVCSMELFARLFS